jgi:carbon storage regulator
LDFVRLMRPVYLRTFQKGQKMLVLTRRIGEEIMIGQDIRVQVVEVQRGRVRLGISAPSEVHVLRSELFVADEAKRRLAEMQAVATTG